MHCENKGLVDDNRDAREKQQSPADRFMSDGQQRDLLEELAYSKGYGGSAEEIKKAIHDYEAQGDFEAAGDLTFLSGDVEQAIEYFEKAGHFRMIGGLYLRVLLDDKKAREYFEKAEDWEMLVVLEDDPVKLEEYWRKLDESRKKHEERSRKKYKQRNKK